MKILKLEDVIKESANSDKLESDEQIVSETGDSNDSDGSDDSEVDIANQKSKYQVPSGKPKSKRVWRSKKSRFKSIVKTPGLRMSKEKKDKLRQELKNVKEHSRSLLEERKKEKEEKRMRRQENLKRQEENQRKSEIVQVIKNTAKIKRMKRKHLRKIEKRDTTNMLKQ